MTGVSGRKPRGGNWDSILLTVLYVWALASGLLASCGIASKGMPDHAFAVNDWFLVRTRSAIFLGLYFFALAKSSCGIVAVHTRSRVSWWLTFALMALNVSMFLPLFLLSPIGAEKPVLAGAPLLPKMAASAVLLLFIVPQLHWLMTKYSACFVGKTSTKSDRQQS